MPWPMVHFAVASRLVANPSPEFLLGSIAPDSIHVRSNITRADKAKTHLMIEEHVFVTDEQLKDYFEMNRQQAMQDKRFMDYLCGYIAHIYTDRVWTFNIYPPYETLPDGRKIYTQDVTKLEFLILQQDGANEWLDKLKVGRAFDLGGLREHEVYQYREEKLQFLKTPEHEPIEDPSVISLSLVNEFITNTAHEIRELYQPWGIMK
ncbi:zinc dependent phospholipase C family protein [Paenibacillus sp. ACRSA]|uniref:zinc dependent phospholipase C family protein n=1 Tax=Paenibacillus sp. ACRSA TaxID=2918211 RepID=UPI001EF6E5FC|nr:zinc dependent phospholipase C family protein [Paenibacillus sp. ACRSA]MCG7379097.1 zinc dependent phospholipase C family protein [Paenibacillus sp. ACRSA]